MKSSIEPPTIDDTNDHIEDIAAIKQIVRDVESGFNNNDAELAVEHFAENASVINALGIRLSGRGDLLESHRNGFAGFLKDQHARYIVDEIQFLRPDVAVAFKQAWATTANLTPLEEDPGMVALYVMVKEAGRWWIVARANVAVPE